MAVPSFRAAAEVVGDGGEVRRLRYLLAAAQDEARNANVRAERAQARADRWRRQARDAAKRIEDALATVDAMRRDYEALLERIRLERERAGEEGVVLGHRRVVARCVYCGVAVSAGATTCPEHKPLVALDPRYQA